MKKWLLPLVLALALLLRIIGLTSHPAGFTPDEASFGYDAYSLLKTGKDQWGASFPLVFKSFGDYKLPLYTYLTIPSVALFGLNEASVRLPNALLGSFAAVVVYFLVYEIFKDKKLAIIASFLLAISPWHIPLSRGAFEANLTTFFLPLAILLFLKGLKQRKWLVFSILVFILNLFTYHTARLLTPLVFISLIYFYKKEIKDKAVYFGALVLFLVAIFGVLTGGARLVSSGIFREVSRNDQYYSVKSGEPVLLAKLFNNKFLYIGETFVKNYLSYFSPQFLITHGPNEATYGMVPGMGVLYLIEVAFLGTFVIKLVKHGVKKEYLFLLFWILISPIPAALTKGPGLAANRVAFAMPAIQIISAIGGVYLYEVLAKKISKKIILVGSGIVFTILFSFFLNNYFVKQRALYAKDMIYGAKEIFKSVDRGMITKKISEPHIYAAFYSQMDPRQYQKDSREWDFVSKGLQWVDQMGEYRLGDYIFSDNYNIPMWLVVVPPEEVPQQVCSSEIRKKIYYPNGQEAFYIRYNGISRSHEC